jgi:hypothetical protein
MSITIAYRGRLADLMRIEDFEDHLIDLALELGGEARIWRCQADETPQRVVRGVLLDLAPGQETTSLLVSPEGWLIGMLDIKNAELGRLHEPPWCFTKTQFGPLAGHVALIELLTALQRGFVPDLEINDEGGYYPTRNLAELTRRHTQVQAAVDGLADGLRRYGLSTEAAKDPSILCRHIERIAAQVRHILQRPAEHPPVTFPEEPFEGATDPDTIEVLWDEMFKNNRRRQEQMERALEERRFRGEDDEAAFDQALNELGLDLPEEELPADVLCDDEQDEVDDLPEEYEDSGPEEAPTGASDPEDDPFAERERHPLLQRAIDLWADLHTVFGGVEPRFEAGQRTLFLGAGEAAGGLVQALARREIDREEYGLIIAQLKRALRGVAFARGALILLRPAVVVREWQDFQRRLGDLEQDVLMELNRARSEIRGGDA